MIGRATAEWGREWHLSFLAAPCVDVHELLLQAYAAQCGRRSQVYSPGRPWLYRSRLHGGGRDYGQQQHCAFHED